jgi:murein DD-endopeptidase MepM/ murein hydrolase activator NlpD
MNKVLETRIYDSPLQCKYVITDRFLYIAGRKSPHTGIDLVCPQGSLIFSPCIGTVLYVGENDTAGNYIVIQTISGMRIEMCHLSDPSFLIPKYSVLQTTLIGYVGRTGNAPGGPHLHLGVSFVNLPIALQVVGCHYQKENLTYLNPEWFMKL